MRFTKLGPRMSQELSMFDALIEAQLTRSDPRG